MQEQNIMSFNPVLPTDFTGLFYFSNPTEEDFIGTWNKKEYLFKANSMTPMVMPDQTPLDIQHIRKKFAKDLAEREFFKGERYEKIRVREGERDELGMIKPRGQGMSHAGTYTLDDLAPFIQKCLDPLPIEKMTVKDAAGTPIEEKLHRDNEGKLTTESISDGISLNK